MATNSKGIANIFYAIVLPLVAIITLFMFLPTAAYCKDDPLSYQNRGNRYEGYRVIEVAGPTFEELSFTRGKSLAVIGSTTVLNVSFFLHQKSKVYIIAKELVAMKHYEMRSTRVQWPQGWNIFGPWETSLVIKPLRIHIANIGVLARIGSERPGSGEITAVQFIRTGADVNRSTYEFQFRTKYDLKKVVYRINKVTESKTIRSGVLYDVIGGTPASIRFELKDQNRGQYRLLLDCLYKGRRGGPQRNYLFYHSP